MSLLLSYEEVDAAAKQNLLLGNGFSQGLHSGFQYGSLKEKAEEAELIGEQVAFLFDRLQTVDFEKVLSRLIEARLVNEAHQIEDDVLRLSYEATREALIQVVSRTHPRRQQLDREKLLHYRQVLRSFQQIFTTNYDLLLYWIAAQWDRGGEGLKGFRDFFWSEGNSFETKKATRKERPEGESGPTYLYYLHGALFLSRRDGKISKVKRQGENDLLTTLQRSLEGAAPVFVSEGDSPAKRRSIAQNEYLEWAYGELEKLSEGITVFGHSLSPQDDHILAALCRSAQGPIAVAVYGSTAKTQKKELARLRDRFAAHDKEDGLYFFDAATFPLLEFT